MKNLKPLQRQSWFNPSEYPFESKYMKFEEGSMHYVDEGHGEVLLFVHGTPTWSFLYRNQIKELSKNFRCIAIDHIGFGLSDKPTNFEGTPEQHTEILTRFIERLNLKNITLVVHDFGGPIALAYAIENPENVERIIMFNTWMWETKSNPEVQKIDKIVNSWIGSFLYLNMNFSPKVLLKQGFHQKDKLTKEIHKHYTKVFPDKNSRAGLLKIAKSLAGSSDWYKSLWERLDAIKDKPFLILWGMQDQFLKPSYLERWKNHLNDAEVIECNCGHFVQEEEAVSVAQNIRIFVMKSGSTKS